MTAWKCIVGGLIVGIVSCTLVGALVGIPIAFDHCGITYFQAWLEQVECGLIMGCLLGPVSGILTWLEKKEGE